MRERTQSPQSVIRERKHMASLMSMIMSRTEKSVLAPKPVMSTKAALLLQRVMVTCQRKHAVSPVAPPVSVKTLTPPQGRKMVSLLIQRKDLIREHATKSVISM